MEGMSGQDDFTLRLIQWLLDELSRSGSLGALATVSAQFTSIIAQTPDESRENLYKHIAGFIFVKIKSSGNSPLNLYARLCHSLFMDTLQRRLNSGASIQHVHEYLLGILLHSLELDDTALGTQESRMPPNTETSSSRDLDDQLLARISQLVAELYGVGLISTAHMYEYLRHLTTSPKAIQPRLVGLCTLLEIQISQLTAGPWSKDMENVIKWATEAASDPSVAESVGNWVRAFVNSRPRAIATSTGSPKLPDHGEHRGDRSPIMGSRDGDTRIEVENDITNENNYGIHMHGTSQPSSPSSVCTSPELDADPNCHQSRPFFTNVTNPGGQGMPNPLEESIYDSSRSQLRQTMQQAVYRRGLPQAPDPRIHRQQDPQLQQLQQAPQFPQMHMPHMPPYVHTQPQPPVPVWPYGSPAYWQQLQQQQRQLQQTLSPYLQCPQQLPQAHNRPIQSTTRTHTKSAQPGATPPAPPKPMGVSTPTPKLPTSSAAPPAASRTTNQPTLVDFSDGEPITDGGASQGPGVVKEPVIGTGTTTRGKGRGGERGRGRSKA